MARSTRPKPPPFLAALVAQMAVTAAALRAWATAAPRTRAAVEQQALVAAQGRGNALLAGGCAVLAATTAVPPHPCACGHPVTARHQRPARVTTLLGPIGSTRASSSCPRCHQGHAPRDRQWGDRAGSTSAGRDALLALLGATADACAAASTRRARRTLVPVCPQLARAATERLGPVRQATAQATVAAAWGPGTLPLAVATPPRWCRALDGVVVHTAAGWRAYT